MRAVILHTWLCAVRDRLLLTLGLALLGAVAASVFLAAQSLIEQRETAIAFIAFATRLIIVPGMALFAITLTQRSFENGEALLQLSRPLSRLAYVAALFLGLLAVTTVLAVSTLLALGLLGVPLPALAGWGAGLLLEASVIIAFALFASLGLHSIMGAFALTLGFYLLARLAGIVNAIAGSDFHAQPGFADRVLAVGARYLTLAMPRLDLFSGAWLLHTPVQSALLGLQLAVYSALLLGCAGFDLQRRRF
jgi:hypothetical protein